MTAGLIERGPVLASSRLSPWLDPASRGFGLDGRLDTGRLAFKAGRGYERILKRGTTMTPQKAITLADDVFEQVKQRAEAEGVSLDEAANEALRLGLSESRWQTLVTRGRTYSREMADAKTDDEAIQIAVDAVHEDRRGR